MNSTSFLKDLQTKVYCRLKPSPIHGIGVFAIRRIPVGINPMQESKPMDYAILPVGMAMDANLDHELKKMLVDFCPEHDGAYDVPRCSLNEIGISWYINHSKTPNMEERDGYFFTTRVIHVGEELTVDYGTYGKENL